MEKIITFLLLVSVSLNVSAFVGRCDMQHVVTPWDKIVSIKHKAIPKSAEEDDIPYGVSIEFLKKFEGYYFVEVYFVVDNYENRWGSRLTVPLAVKADKGAFYGYIKLPAKELGKHGVLVVWHNERNNCDADRYFPIDA